MNDTMEILEEGARWREAGSGVALATVVKTWGSAPRPAGSQIAVRDDGVGLPVGQPSSLGLEIVETLVREDLRGKLDFKSGKGGTRVIVTLPQTIAEIGDEH